MTFARKVLWAAAPWMLVTCASAQTQLTIGDKAPPLIVTQWVQLNPFSDWSKDKPIDIATAARGKVTVLEFWATWCPPCIQLIPQVNDLYSRYKDMGLLVIAVTDSGRGQQFSTVKRFVDRRGDDMNYPIAFDATERSGIEYVFGTGSDGLPHAVVIGKDGRIAWAGHPGQPEMHEVIDDLLHDRFDLAAQKAKAERAARVQPLLMEFNQALNRSDWPQCMSICDRILVIDPANSDALRFAVALQLEHVGSRSELRKWIDAFIDKHKAESDPMANLAALLSTLPDLTLRQPDLALKAARAAYDADPSDTRNIELLAHVTYQIGELDQAIELQKKALRTADAADAEHVRQVLAYYQACKALQSDVASK